MTGGTAVILGRVGDNFGAGMTGGMAFVFDATTCFESRVNAENVIWQRVASSHWEQILKSLIERHVLETDSKLGVELLRNWDTSLGRFWQVCPIEMVNRITHPLTDDQAAKTA
jgi:glutamate synthase (NADPH/NADH) large chain